MFFFAFKGGWPAGREISKTAFFHLLPLAVAEKSSDAQQSEWGTGHQEGIPVPTQEPFSGARGRPLG